MTEYDLANILRLATLTMSEEQIELTISQYSPTVQKLARKMLKQLDKYEYAQASTEVAKNDAILSVKQKKADIKALLFNINRFIQETI